MSMYNQVRKFVDIISRLPVGPSLHGIIVVGPAAATSAWRHLRDYATTYRDVQIVEPLQMVFFATGATIKVIDILDSEELSGIRLRSVLLTQKLTGGQQQELAAVMYKALPAEPAPKPVFGL